MAVATVSSCTAIEADNGLRQGYEAEPSVMAFSPVIGAPTRSIIDSGTEFPTDRTMQLAAYLGSGTGGTEGALYFDGGDGHGGVTYSYDSTAEAWKSATPFYWPLAGNLLIYAASTDAGDPSAAAATVTFTDKTGFTIACEGLGTGQDILAGMIAAATGSNNDIALSHTGALIVVTAQSSDAFDATNNYGIEITGVTLLDVLPNTTVTCTKSSSTLNISAAASGDVADKVVSSTAKKPGTTAATLGKIIIPANQPMTSLKIDYKLYSGSANGTPLSITHDLSGTWALGKKYTYQISATLGGISVNAELTDWQDGDSSNINI